MGFNVSPGFGKSAAKVMMAAFLASAATGCSSDVTRFGGIFGSGGQDRMATSSIQRPSSQSEMTPTADLDRSGGSQPVYAASQNGGQTYPSATYGSSARMASAPVSVQRTELSAPGAPSAPAAARPVREKQVALVQPFPGGVPRKQTSSMLAPPKQAARESAAQTDTGQTESGWSATNAPSVTLRPGETVSTLARRYGVPEKEILRINGMRSASAAQPGQAILIPTYNGGNAAKASADASDLSKGHAPDAPKAPEQKVAVMPGAGSPRDKASADAGAAKIPAAGGKDPKPAGDSYTVKSGDSLAKIAKATGADIDAIKQANNLSGGSLKIGQQLVIPNGAAGEGTKTAAAQAKVVQASVKPAEAAAVKAPVATESVDDAASKDTASVSPEGTGIGKFRWPVRGAVIAGYGANVNGSRNDGIDISVPQGTPIKAAENGVVIYAGNGLKQLGNTVLVRHDDGTVTVYGNADTLSVARGQKIQRGQTVAVSGMSGDVKQPQVHFEVRKNATPVNPITFLE